MSQQLSPLQQDANPFRIHVQCADDETVSQAEEHYPNQYQLLLHPAQFSYHGAVDPVVAYQSHTQFTNDFTSATNYSSFLQEHGQPLVVPFVVPPPSSPIPIPTLHGAIAESSPFSSLSTSASTSSSAGVTNPEVCRQSQPLFNEQTQQWSCGGCNRAFSDKYVTDRHIATVGLKVTCRYCGSRVSTLESSRRRHFRRESCRRQGLERGFATRNEEDAFVEDH